MIGVIAIAFIRNKPLSTKNSAEQLRANAEESAIEVAEAEVGAATGSIRVIDADGAETASGRVLVLERDDDGADDEDAVR